jgi:hypothetical protein
MPGKRKGKGREDGYAERKGIRYARFHVDAI